MQRFSLAARTEPTRAACVCEPRHTDAITDTEATCAGAEEVDRADSLVPRNDVRVFGREITLGEMKIRAAHAARVYANSHLPGPRHGDRALHELERMVIDRTGHVDDPRGDEISFAAAHRGTIVTVAFRPSRPARQRPRLAARRRDGGGPLDEDLVPPAPRQVRLVGERRRRRPPAHEARARRRPNHGTVPHACAAICLMRS